MTQLARGVSIEGHPDPDFNGLYKHDSMHEGWPVLKNAKGMYCYRHTPSDRWYLGDKFTPDERACYAYIVATEGTLPVGAHMWRVAQRQTVGWHQHTLTATLLVGQSAVSAAERQFAQRTAEAAKANAARLSAVRAQLDGARGVSFRERGWGSLGDFWGDYEHHSTHQGWHGSDHEGWPVLKNANGMYLYYHQPKKRWFLRNQCLPEQDGAAIFFDAPEGPLPVGVHTWQVRSGGMWQDRKLEVTLLPK